MILSVFLVPNILPNIGLKNVYQMHLMSEDKHFPSSCSIGLFTVFPKANVSHIHIWVHWSDDYQSSLAWPYAYVQSCIFCSSTIWTVCHHLENHLMSNTWHTPVVIRRPKQEDCHMKEGQAGLHREFTASLNCMSKLCLQKQQEKIWWWLVLKPLWGLNTGSP